MLTELVLLVALVILPDFVLAVEALFTSDFFVSAGLEQPTIEIVMAAIKNAAKTFLFILHTPLFVLSM